MPSDLFKPGLSSSAISEIFDPSFGRKIDPGRGQKYGYRAFAKDTFKGNKSASQILGGLGGYSSLDASTDVARSSINNFFSRNAFRSRIHRLPTSIAKETARSLPFSALFAPIDLGMKLSEGQGFRRALTTTTTGTIGDIAFGSIGAAVGGAVLGPAGAIVGGLVGSAVGYMGGEQIGELGVAGVNYLGALGKRSKRTELGGSLSRSMLTTAAYTMRSRGIAQMQRSGVNARSFLGREASVMHQRSMY